MSSETEGQLVTFTCDECGEEFACAGSWRDVWQAAKDDGWRCFQDDNGEWQHRCPSCVGV